MARRGFGLVLAKVKAKFISRMRWPQSDPSHTHAPVCPCLRARYACVARARRVGMRGALMPRGLTGCQGLALHHFGAAGLSGLYGVLWARGYVGSTGLICGLLGLFPGLGGPLARAWRAGQAGQRARCLFSLCKTTVLAGHTAWHGVRLGVCLSVWHSPGMASPGVRPRLAEGLACCQYIE